MFLQLGKALLLLLTLLFSFQLFAGKPGYELIVKGYGYSYEGKKKKIKFTQKHYFLKDRKRSEVHIKNKKVKAKMTTIIRNDKELVWYIMTSTEKKKTRKAGYQISFRALDIINSNLFSSPRKYEKSDDEIRIKDTKKKETINGYPCRIYKIYKNGELVGKMWLYKGDKLKLIQTYERHQLKILSKRYKKKSRPPKGGGGFPIKILGDNERAKWPR